MSKEQAEMQIKAAAYAAAAALGINEAARIMEAVMRELRNVQWKD